MPRSSAAENEDGLVRCICQNKANYVKFIQCEECFIWQHMRCMGVDENNEPKAYYCDDCSPESHTINEKTYTRLYKFDKSCDIKRRTKNEQKDHGTAKSDTKEGPNKPLKAPKKDVNSIENKEIKNDSKDENIKATSPTKFTTLRGRRTNKVPYNQIESKETEMELEKKQEINDNKASENNGAKKPAKRQYIRRKVLNNNNNNSNNNTKVKTYSDVKPVLSPIKLLSPMKTYQTQPASPSFFNNITNPSTLSSPKLPVSSVPAPPLISKQPSPPPKPRSTHGKLSVKEALKRADAIQSYIESFQDSLNDHPDSDGVFPNSIILANNLLYNINQFKEKFEN